VLTVVGRGATFAEAIERAYGGVAKISFEGMQYRRDIGKGALIDDLRFGDRRTE
jgi:phosphoribosylamine--glycine ligase